MKRLSSIDARFLYGSAVMLVFACHVALYAGTVVDDAFIVFRYARNMANGLGLVFNPGERVEGTTSLLWTFWIAAGVRAGLDATRFALFSGVSFGAMTLAYITWRFHWLIALALACSGPFAYWCVTGLETPLFTGVLCVALGELYHVGVGTEIRRSLITSAAAFGLLHWIRPDAMLFIPLVALPVVFWRRSDLSRRDLMLASAWALLPYVGLLSWRYIYFGEIEANTYYAKVSMPWYEGFQEQCIQQGLPYVASFWKTFPFLAAVAVASFVGAVLSRQKVLLVLHAALVVYQGYFFFVGGDWMPQFRWYVPLLAIYPALALAVCARRWLAGVVAALLCVTLLHQSVGTFLGKGTRRFLDKNTDFSRVLAREFNTGSPWSEAVLLGDIGMMGWLSNMRIVDAAGLVDRHIAHRKAIHFWKVDTPYLLSRDAEWVIVRYHYWWHPPDAPTRAELTRRIAAQPDEMLFTPEFWMRNAQLGRWPFEQELLRSAEFHGRYATLAVWPEIDQPQFTAIFCRRDICTSPVAERLRKVAPTFGEAKAEMGRPDAEKYLRRTFEVIPNEETSMVALAQRLEDAGTLGRIARTWGLVVSDRVGAYTALGLDAYSEKRFEQALEYFEAAVRLDGSVPYQLSNVGWALQALGRREQAEEWFARAKGR